MHRKRCVIAESSPLRTFPITRIGQIWLLVSLITLLLVGGVMLFLALRNPPAWQLDVGMPHDTRFLAGFSIPETSTPGHTPHPLPTTSSAAATTTFRWSIAGSRLALHGTPIGTFLLDLRLSGDANAGPLLLEYHEPSTTIARFAIGAGWRVYRILLPPPAPIGWGETPPLFLRAETYVSAAHDQRSLGVPLDWLRLTPLMGETPVWPTMQRAIVLVWGLAVLAGWFWLVDQRFSRLLDRRCPPLARMFPSSLTPLRVHAVVILATIVLVLWAMRDPYGMAWVLPPSPWILGIASLVLVRYGLPQCRAIEQCLSKGVWPRPIGIALLVVAQILFSANVWGGGIGCAAMGIVVLASAPPHPSSPRLFTTVRHPGVLLIWIALLALGLRFAYLDRIPYGMWRDEARHGLIALRILEDPSYRPVYVASGGVNMPALGFYPFALAIKLWGIHAWSMRPMVALAGALTVIPLYAFVARLSGRASIGLVAAALLACSSWHISLSRFSFPSVFEPFLLCCGLWLMVVTLDPASPPHHDTRSRPTTSNQWLRALQGFGAGVCLGFAVQHYHTGRVVPIVAGCLALILVVPIWRNWPMWLPGLIGIGIGALLTLAPLMGYILNHPSAFNHRVSEVFLLGAEAKAGRPPLAVLDESVGAHVLMFHGEGDHNGRHHAPGSPMLDPITGLGFLIGCGVLLQRGGGRNLFLAMGLVIGLLPSLLAVEYPHAMRSIGAIVFACTIAAIGLVEGVGWMSTVITSWTSRVVRISGFFGGQTPEPYLTVMAGGGLLGMALAWNVWTYFLAMPTNPSVWLAFYPIHTKVGEFVRAEGGGANPGDPIYVPFKFTHNAVFTYLTRGIPFQTYEHGNVSHPITVGARFVISGYATHEAIEATLNALANTSGYPRAAFVHAASGPPLPDGVRPSFVVYQVRSPVLESP